MTEHEHSPTPAPGQRKHILVVDDEDLLRLTLKTLLTAHGYRVDTAEDGKVALDYLKRRRFDLVILDLAMPRVSGYDVLEGISDTVLRETHFVILTVRKEDRDILKGYSMGATYYLPKPWDKERLLNIVNYLIGDLPPDEKQKLEVKL